MGPLETNMKSANWEPCSAVSIQMHSLSSSDFPQMS
jgi:hypothetical protein